MSPEPVADVDVLAAWSLVAERVARGESVPFVAHGQRIGDIVPSSELDRLRETIEVLSDPDALRDLLDDSPEDQLEGVDAVQQLLQRRVTRNRRGDSATT